MSPEEIFKTMQKLIVEQFALDPDEVTMDSSFEEDLGADSVDLVELVIRMLASATRFNCPPDRCPIFWEKSRIFSCERICLARRS